MSRRPALVFVLVALVLGAPIVSAFTFDAWTDGIHDAETEFAVQATTTSADAALVAEPVSGVAPRLVVVAILAFADDAVATPITLATSDPRAPPLA